MPGLLSLAGTLYVFGCFVAFVVLTFHDGWQDAPNHVGYTVRREHEAGMIALIRISVKTVCWPLLIVGHILLAILKDVPNIINWLAYPPNL